MGIFSKIVTALRGGAREVGNAIVDANGVRIFEQEIHDAEGHLKKAKRDLTEVMAKEMRTQRDVTRLSKEVEEHETYATEALNKGREDLALEVAGRIVELTTDLEAQREVLSTYGKHAARLKKMIHQADRQIQDLRRQLTMARTTESVHKATASITENYANSNSRLTTAKESLDRIRKRQTDREDRLEAGEVLDAEFSGDDLQSKLEKAGISAADSKSNAQDVLNRIRAQSKS